MVVGENFEVSAIPGNQFTDLAGLQEELLAVFGAEMIGVLFDLLDRKELVIENQQLLVSSKIEERRIE